MSDYAWGIQLEDEGEEPTAHVVDFEAGETALCGVTAVLRLDGEASLPVCEECKRQALAAGIITETDGEDGDRPEAESDENDAYDHELFE